jgi:hypothetical protein
MMIGEFWDIFFERLLLQKSRPIKDNYHIVKIHHKSHLLAGRFGITQTLAIIHSPFSHLPTLPPKPLHR